MKLCLIAATQPEDLNFWANLGFAYLAAFARREIPDLEVRVANTPEELERSPADLVGISAVSQDYGEAIRLARNVKTHLHIPVLIGGPHITALPQTLDSFMDVAILGEGEETLVELLRVFGRTGGLPAEDLQDVLGIAFRNKRGSTTCTPLRPLIDPLDRIPHPDREVLRYQGEETYLFTSRGCPFKCTFCSSTVHWRKFRAFSPAYVVEEIRLLHERYGTCRVHFFDDLFMADLQRLAEICRLAKSEPWHGRMEFSCAVRAELVTPEMVELLTSLHVTRTTFGAESHDEQVLSYLKGASASPVSNQRAVDLFSAAGIMVGLSFIKGAPGETKAALRKTYDFIHGNIREGKIDQADINVLTPFPGTQVWELAEERGVVSEHMDWALLRRPWPKLVVNRLLVDEAAWILCREQDIQLLLDFVRNRDVHALIAAEEVAASPKARELASRLARVRRVKRWFLACSAEEAPAWKEIALPRGCTIHAGPDAEERWAEPQRDRIHVRLSPTALDQPGELDAVIWALEDLEAEAVRWADDRKVLAEVLSPPAMLKAPEQVKWRSFSSDDTAAAVARRIGDQPDLATAMVATVRLTVLLHDRMLRAESNLRRAGQALTAMEREPGLLRRSAGDLQAREAETQADNERRGQAIRYLEAEVARHIQRIQALQREVEEKNAWAAALDHELHERIERILALQREVEEKNTVIARLSRDKRASR